ncbi:MAG TPA: hypothetical protein VFA78_01000, partial [Chloroflexota bacterium]|nr:hypothetical protein [Chloroflexota bacterium]
WARWGLVVLLVLIVLAIIAGAYLATHPHTFGASPTNTPTVTPKPKATATPKPASGAGGATPTPTLGKKATPTPTASGATPTATPNSGSTPTATPKAASGLRIGKIAHPKSQIDQYQSGANAGNSQYTYYTDPYKVVQTNLSQYGFTGSFTIVQPAATPTPTPYTNAIGLPQVRFIVQYNGKKYGIFLDQPVQKGPKGIWVIIAIWPCAGTTYCT